MKKKSLLASLLIFAAGLLLIVAAGILLHKLIPLETEKYIFMWNSIGIVFILAFVPIFFEQVTVRNADRKLISLVVYYRGFVFYALASAAIIVLLFGILELKYAILLQVAVLILFAVYVAVSYLVSGHVKNVAETENAKTAPVDSLRARAKSLVILADRLGAEDEDIRRMARNLSDDLRYLTPSNDPNAQNLDNQISLMLDSLTSDGYFMRPNPQARENVIRKFDALRTLFAQRKAIF